MADNIFKVNPKIGKLILIALIIISLVLTGLVFGLFQKERAKNFSLQAQLEDVKAKQRMAEARLDESKKMISDMQTKLQDSQAQIESITAEVQKERDAKQQALVEIDQLKSDLENQKEMRSGLEKKISQAQEDTTKAQAQLKELEAKKAELEDRIRELEASSQAPQAKPIGVELGKIVVSPETAKPMGTGQTQATPAKPEPSSPATSNLTGKILVINKEYNFAVINLGSRDGVAVGDIFAVYHKNKEIGDIKVEKVHDAMSAAGFMSSEAKNKFSEGDRVVLKAK